MRDDIVEFGLVTKGAIEGDEDGGSVPTPISIEEWSPVISRYQRWQRHGRGSMVTIDYTH